MVGCVGVQQRAADLRGEWRAGHLLVLIPLGLIVLISVVDISASPDIHLGPLLVVAPAITASFGGPRLTALIGVLAVAAQAVIAYFHGGLWTANHQAQLVALTLISAAIVLYCRVRARHEQELSRVRSVSEAVQRVLLRPLPEQLGPLRVAALYLAADDEACVGGDLYAAARTGGATRLIIGDVRGKGLTAVGDAAAVLGAFRELAHHHADLPDLATGLEASYCRHLAELREAGQEVRESFVTVLLLEIPDDRPVVRLTACGHPPPLLVRGRRVRSLDARQPGPPLGMCELPRPAHDLEEFAFEPGDLLLLHTDGVTEARDREAEFYPLAERVAALDPAAPEELLHALRQDLLAHVGGRLPDDAALIAIERTASAAGAG